MKNCHPTTKSSKTFASVQSATRTLALCSALLMTSHNTFAAPTQNIAYVNSQKIFQALPQREATLKKLEKEIKDQAESLKVLQKKIKEKADKGRRDKELLGEKGLDKLKIELASLEAEYKIKAQSFQHDSQDREVKAKTKLFKVIQNAVKQVAEKKGYDMVIDAQFLQYAKPGLDLSDEVISTIKKKK